MGRSTVKRVTTDHVTSPVPAGPARPLDPPGPPDQQLAELPRELAELPQPLAELDFVIVDVETTGWLPEEAGITEIGAVLVRGGQVRSQFCTLVNPGSAIPADITALTGITDAMVGQAPPISAVMPPFLTFARGCVLTAHNAAFDVGFLSAACGNSGLPWPAFPVLDTVLLARLVLGAGEVPDRRLSTLASFFGTADDAVSPGAARRHGHRGGAAGPAAQAGRGRRAHASGTQRQLRRQGQLSGTLRPPPGHRPAAEEAQVVTAIVLVKADVARIPETAETIAQIPQVSEVYSVTGEFDLVAMVRVRGHEELGDVIPGNLNKVPGVTHTETHIAFRTYSRHDLDAAFALGYADNT